MSKLPSPFSLLVTSSATWPRWDANISCGVAGCEAHARVTMRSALSSSLLPIGYDSILFQLPDGWLRTDDVREVLRRAGCPDHWGYARSTVIIDALLGGQSSLLFCPDHTMVFLTRLYDCLEPKP